MNSKRKQTDMRARGIVQNENQKCDFQIPFSSDLVFYYKQNFINTKKLSKIICIFMFFSSDNKFVNYYVSFGEVGTL